MTPYDLLGVTRDASADEIKQAFRECAKECHPDRLGGDDTQFKIVKHAYEVLADPNRRAFYDLVGRDPVVDLGLDDEMIAQALRERRGRRIRPNRRRVPRSECLDCAGTGWRSNRRACTSCDPTLSATPRDAGADWSPAEPVGGGRVKMTRPTKGAPSGRMQTSGPRPIEEPPTMAVGSGPDAPAGRVTLESATRQVKGSDRIRLRRKK